MASITSTFKSSSKEMNKLIRSVRKYGITAVNRNANHIRITLPGGSYVSASNTPSDTNAIHRVKKDIVRAAQQAMLIERDAVLTETEEETLRMLERIIEHLS